jgi:hypothetical protein
MSGHLSRLVTRAAQRSAPDGLAALPGSPGAAWGESHLAAFAARGGARARPGDRRPLPDLAEAGDDHAFSGHLGAYDPGAREAETAGPMSGHDDTPRGASSHRRLPLRAAPDEATDDEAPGYERQLARQVGPGRLAGPEVAGAARRSRPPAARAAARRQSRAPDPAGADDGSTYDPGVSRGENGDQFAGRDPGTTGRVTRRQPARSPGALPGRRLDRVERSEPANAAGAERGAADGSPGQPRTPRPRQPLPRTAPWEHRTAPPDGDMTVPVGFRPAAGVVRRSPSSGPGPAGGGPGAISIHIGRVELVVPAAAGPSPAQAPTAAPAGGAADRGGAGHPDLLGPYRGYQARGGP